MHPRHRSLLCAALLLALAACGGSKSSPGPREPDRADPGAGGAAAPGAAAAQEPRPGDRDHRIEVLCIRYTGGWCDDDGERQVPFAALPAEQKEEVLEECRTLLGRRPPEVLDAAEACLECESDCVAIDGCLSPEPHRCDQEAVDPAADATAEDR